MMRRYRTYLALAMLLATGVMVMPRHVLHHCERFVHHEEAAATTDGPSVEQPECELCKYNLPLADGTREAVRLTVPDVPALRHTALADAPGQATPVHYPSRGPPFS